MFVVDVCVWDVCDVFLDVFVLVSDYDSVFNVVVCVVDWYRVE